MRPHWASLVLLTATALFAACDQAAEPKTTRPTLDLVGGSTEETTSETQALLDLVLPGDQLISMSDPAYAAEELPGLGHKFELFFTMMDDDDPDNPTNDDISDFTTPAIPAGFAIAFRKMPPGIKITALEDQLGFKYFFVGRSCGGGSPRVTLFVDADGDGDFDQDPPISDDDPADSPDFAAHGHPTPFEGCPPNTWVYENLTDNGPRWEVTPGGAVGPTVPVFPFVPWDVLEAAVTTTFGSHRVIAGFIVDDSCSFSAPSCGEAHYDLLTIENRTLENDQDTVKK